MKKILIIILSLMMLIQCFPVFASDLKYIDVKENDWFYEVVDECTKLGIINGFPDGSFKPSGKLKEDQVLKMVLSAYNYEVRELKQGEYWAMPYIEKADELKIVDLKAASLYDREITREEVARIIVNAIFLNEERPTNNFQIAKEYIKDFSDIKEPYKQDILDLFVLGIMQGNNKRMIKPKETITRAEMAAIIVRVALKEKRLPMITEIPASNSEPEDDEYIIVKAPVFEGKVLTEVTDIALIMQKAVKETIGGDFFGVGTEEGKESNFGVDGWGTDENIKFLFEVNPAIPGQWDEFLLMMEKYFEYSFDFVVKDGTTQRPKYDLTIWKAGNLDRTNLETYDKYFLYYYGKTFEDVFKYMFEDEYEEFWGMFIEGLKYDNPDIKMIKKTMNDREIYITYRNDSVSFYSSPKGIKFK